MEVGLKISTTLTCSILEKLLRVLVGVDLGIGTALLPPIIKATMVYHLFFLLMMITEVEIGLTPANFIHIIMVD